MQPPKNSKQIWAVLGLVGYYQKFIQNFAWLTKPHTTLTCHNAKSDWMPDHQVVFASLKGALIQAPILKYPDPSKWYIVYTGASDNTFGAQLSQEHFFHTHSQTLNENGALLSKCLLQGSDISMHNGDKPLQKFLNSKNVNSKVSWWSLELTTYITFEWISGAWNKAAGCLSW